MENAKVAIIMGSKSDLPIMQDAIEVLKYLGVSYEVSVVSAHRTPKRMFDFAEQAAGRGLKVIIAGAGGAAHLPGMVASITHLPVIGVPVKSSNSIDGWDSVLSILQMPNGIPVATVALNAAKNAGILAAQILATSDDALAGRILEFKKELKDKVEESAEEVERLVF
ncbi:MULTISPECIES: 5-(carboxyamino)imidazole ribonucleotide mutase [Sphingobacterium]|uniref:N5-carboxyaminoimidazole ribonucleotide mutase n=1 Tax=Sphingobacterium cellulitidis TaxID=1768011 RepID=A0A8H9KS54_9SPHI|nr:MULTISPECIES: 5-(carboxyamino)imidazole ribonucleotide mutase [Sphingobacterium]MBA8985712.1 5-(carboxyamino)imidazole ribonucleotide mutase [Sphingobacterium soli]OYD43812.1 5-(carboxyamino)imidazole ribonucleotide mutase [Sphingobacterium cellulitidis]OYD47072.1 5-(carboxyamino)imidazole ribonucleotide mutase [Sphingobacterium cellulitidis]WFB64124.1 5-(carboxyamino)imidazole ribonucleotide mutase [Sphingobacterium sp. WM]GGE07502.1 N5-carboxyaminoimidazole ribonucleotide mutase [Sphingob